jgi:osmotically-inducible protein OsmY
MKRRYGAQIGALLLTGMLAGCNSQDAKNLTHDTATLAKDTGQALGSATLAGKVNSVLALRKGVDMSGLHVEATEDGTVTLSGHVRNKEEKQRVLDTVDGIRGVDKIVSKDLRVQP